MNATISQWLGMSREELDGIYTNAKAGAVPRGDTHGTAIVAGSSLARGLAAFARAVAWKGKVFDMFAEEGEKGVRSEERRVGKSVDVGGRRIIKKKKS